MMERCINRLIKSKIKKLRKEMVHYLLNALLIDILDIFGPAEDIDVGVNEN